MTREVRDGGTFYVLSNAQAQRAACLLETCEARRLQLEPVARDTTWQAWVLGLGAALLVGMVVGAVLAVYVGR